MHIAGRGIIARLPEAIRTQLNQRFRNGEPGAPLVNWLNSLPAVQTVIANEFDGKPAREQNLSEWRTGGYSEWLDQQKAMAMAPPVAAELEQQAQAAGAPIINQMSMWLAVRYLIATKQLTGAGGGESDWTRLRPFLHDVVALRRSEHNAEGLELERQKFGYSQSLEHGKLDCRQLPSEDRALELWLEEAKACPEVFESFQSALKLMKERNARENSPPNPA